MPLTTDKRLLRALKDHEFLVDTGRDGGLSCPICMRQLAGDGSWYGGCDHLLSQDLDGNGEERACWHADEDEGFSFDPKKAKRKTDRFLIDREWIPVFTIQSDTGGMGWEAWFAFPVSIFKGKKSPVRTVNAKLKDMEKWLESEEEDDEEPGNDAD